jgi:hypothetical protein
MTLNKVSLLFGFSLLFVFVTFSLASSTQIEPKVELVEAFPKLKFSNAVALLANPSKDDDYLYVVQLNGVVLCFPNSPTTKPDDVKVFLNITNRITNEGEMGLLGFAFHPNFPETPVSFVLFTLLFPLLHSSLLPLLLTCSFHFHFHFLAHFSQFFFFSIFMSTTINKLVVQSTPTSLDSQQTLESQPMLPQSSLL